MRSTVMGAKPRRPLRVPSGRRRERDEEGRAALRTWLRLLACATLMERRVSAGLREEFATTLPRFDVLAQLDAAEGVERAGLTMSELSRRLMVTNGNLTGLIARLVGEGLVRRSASTQDGRTQIVRLTTAGRRALGHMLPVHREWIVTMLSGLSPRDRDRLYDLLGTLRDSVRRTQVAGERETSRQRRNSGRE